MDRRSTPRFPVGLRQPVQLTLLSSDGQSDQTVDAEVADWSAAGMRVTAALEVPPGTPVRISWPDQLILGECCHCAETASGQYSLGLKLGQVLGNLASLRRLSDRLMGESRSTRETVPS